MSLDQWMLWYNAQAEAEFAQIKKRHALETERKRADRAFRRKYGWYEEDGKLEDGPDGYQKEDE